jgi:hypothetical protein
MLQTFQPWMLKLMKANSFSLSSLCKSLRSLRLIFNTNTAIKQFCRFRRIITIFSVLGTNYQGCCFIKRNSLTKRSHCGR